MRIVKTTFFLALIFLSAITIRADDEVVDDVEIESEESQGFHLDGLSPDDMQKLNDASTKQEFQAEVNRLMNIIIHSLYKNKEIFLRELISNSADALDKIRLASLTDKSALGDNEVLDIKIRPDKENRAIHIIDSGIGMTEAELKRNLGTIAKSGTAEFLEKLTSSQSAEGQSDLIGQFGVGFYSSFLIADEVIVTSKHNNDSQFIWSSDSHSFNVVKDPRGNTLGRGTVVTLRLKEEAEDFLEEKTLEDLVKKYSQFINFPIYLWSDKTVEKEVPLEEGEEEEEAEKPDEEKEAEEKSDDAEVEEEKPKTKTVSETFKDWVLMNNIKPIWMRKPSDISDEEYIEFYKSITKDWDEPLTWIHFTAEGEVTFRALLYVPKRPPKDLMSTQVDDVADGIKLYVRRVFITDDFRDMMPRYLSFSRGVVDSDDLPLNIGRETLQQHKLLKVIKKKLVRKTLDMLRKLSEEKYTAFYKEFSTHLKLGVIDDHSNRNRIAKMVRYQSSRHPTELTSLVSYIDRMKSNQDLIFYNTGQSRQEVENSPFVERLLKRGYEVLYLTEAIDEYTMQSLPEFDGKKFQHVAKEGLKLDESEGLKAKREALKEEFEPLTTWLTETALKESVEKVELSERLSSSPCALVAKAYGWSGNFERIRKAQAYARSDDPSNSWYAEQKKILEINPGHPIIRELLARVKEDPANDVALDTAQLLYDTTVLRSGYELSNKASFAERLERAIRDSLSVSPDAQVVDPLGEDDEIEEEEIDDLTADENDIIDDNAGEEEEMHEEL